MMMDLFRGLFLLQMGFSVILASFEVFGFGLFGEVMKGRMESVEDWGYLQCKICVFMDG